MFYSFQVRIVDFYLVFGKFYIAFIEVFMFPQTWKS